MLASAGEALKNPHGKHDETADLVGPARDDSFQLSHSLGTSLQSLVENGHVFFEAVDVRELVLEMDVGLSVRQPQLTGLCDGTDGEITGVEQGQFEVHHLLAQFGDERVAWIGVGGRFGVRRIDAIV